MKKNETVFFSIGDFNKNEKLIFLSIALLYFLFLIARIFANNYFLVDSYEYLEISNSIHYFTYFENTKNPELYLKRPILYPLFLAFFVNFHPLFIVIVQTIFSLFGVFAIFKILKHFEMQSKKWMLILYLFTPSFFIYSQLIMAEWLVMLLLCLLFWVIIQKWSSKNFIIIQIITVLLAFTKPVFYPFIYINFIFFITYFIKNKFFSLWLFFPIIILQLFLNYNENKTGYRCFSSIENTNLINYNLYYFKAATLGKKEADKWQKTVFESDLYKDKNFKDRNDYLKKTGFLEIKNNLFTYSTYHFLTGIRGFFDPGRYDLMTFFKVEQDGKQGFLEILNGNKPLSILFTKNYMIVYLLLIPILLLTVFKLFFSIVFLLQYKHNFLFYYIPILFVYHILVSGPVNCSRYNMPFQGILIIATIVGFHIYFNSKKSRYRIAKSKN